MSAGPNTCAGIHDLHDFPNWPTWPRVALATTTSAQMRCISNKPSGVMAAHNRGGVLSPHSNLRPLACNILAAAAEEQTLSTVADMAANQVCCGARIHPLAYMLCQHILLKVGHVVACQCADNVPSLQLACHAWLCSGQCECVLAAHAMLTRRDACQALPAQFLHLLLPNSLSYIWTLQLDPMPKLHFTTGRYSTTATCMLNKTAHQHIEIWD